MAISSPLDQPCPHLATPQEHDRDPEYQACNAQPGEPCRWARRYEAAANPPFHAVRLERAWQPPEPLSPEDAAAFRNVVLQSGLV